MSGSLSVCLLHEEMVDKQGKIVTTSLTLIDLHDISRCAKTYGLAQAYIAHPSEALRNLAGKLTNHWQKGYGASYNPDRKAALDNLTVCKTLDDVIQNIKQLEGKQPKLVATSAKDGGERITFSDLKGMLATSEDHYLLMLGTGWGMSEELLKKADYFLEPIASPTEYNHLSVRTACAIMLDRLCKKSQV